MFVSENLYRRDWVIRFLYRLRCCKRQRVEPNHLQPQMGVDNEKQFTENVIRTNTMDQYPIVLHNLGKVYGKLHAVAKINLSIRKGKCCNNTTKYR